MPECSFLHLTSFFFRAILSHSSQSSATLIQVIPFPNIFTFSSHLYLCLPSLVLSAINTDLIFDRSFSDNGTSCFQFWKQNFDQVCFLRYGWENNSIVDKACFALGVRIQKYSSISLDYECIKHMSDGTTHVGPLNITQPDLNFLANFTLYGAASSNNQSVFALLLSVVSALLIARYES